MFTWSFRGPLTTVGNNCKPWEHFSERITHKYSQEKAIISSTLPKCLNYTEINELFICVPNSDLIN